jgi:hypothetical protein
VFVRANLPTTGTNQVSTATVARIVNAKILVVCIDFPAIEKLDTILIDSTMEGGVLPSDFDRLRYVQMIYSDIVRVPLTPLPPDSAKWATPGDATQDQSVEAGPPNYYTAGGYLMLHPKWSRGDTGTYLISYYATDTALTDDASQTSVDTRYLDAVIYASVAEVNRILGRWNQAMGWQALYEEYKSRHGATTVTAHGEARRPRSASPTQ